MSIPNIGPEGRARLRLVMSKTLDTIEQLAERATDPERRAKFMASAEKTRQKINKLRD